MNSAPEEQPGSFCQAIFFFYTCGCRTPQPVFCCQPPPGQQVTRNPCRHENPSLVTAKIPHSCGRSIGNSEACGAEDPGKKEFVREVDTAERLELVVSGGVEQDKICNVLPGKVEGAFTIDQVVSKSQRDEKRKSAFSATAAPFVPRSGGCGVAPGSVTTKENNITACRDHNKTSSDAPMNTNKVVTGTAILSRVKDKVKDKVGGKGKHQRNNDDLAEGTTRNEVGYRTKPKDAPSNTENTEFVDIELDVLTPGDKADDQESKPRTSVAENMPENQGRGASTQLDGSYDDIMKFYWAMDQSQADLRPKPKPKPVRTCYWAITSIFSKRTAQTAEQLPPSTSS
ncbi:hypothetical protein F5X98DRAFT_109767 [Xylaria grammica]|nr:hypothetical protein F5X98DRAFT_109767 [Xylaria grammica]